MTTLTRRDLFRTALAAGVSLMVPNWLHAAGPIALPFAGKVLILVELDGGNDSLNMFVPVPEFALYQTKRPSIRLSTTSTIDLPLSELRSPIGLTSHYFNWNLVDGAGKPGRLKALFESGEIAIQLGVGMLNPNRSHFRGMDIWNSGSDAQVQLTDGWIKRAFAATTDSGLGLVANGILLSRATSNPILGDGMKVLALDDGASFTDSGRGLGNPAANSSYTGLQHVIQTARDVYTAWDNFDDRFPATADEAVAPDLGAASFPGGDFGDQCKAVAEMIAAGILCPVYKIRLGGFDNHSDQRRKHDDLLADLAHGLSGLRDALVHTGTFNRVLIQTYSEFGRRVEQNDSQGTDHGTVGAHFAIGSAAMINGGVYGTQPSIADGALDERGDMVASMDYRKLWATSLTWLGLTNIFDPTHQPITGLLK